MNLSFSSVRSNGLWRHGLGVAVMLASLAGSAFARQADSRLNPAEVAAEASPGVVMIETPSGSGSGVVVESSGVIVTNLHVVRGDTEVVIRMSNGDIFEDVEVVDVDARRDIVLLKIKAFNLPTVRLGDSDGVEIGEPVVVIGSPRGLAQSVTTGIVSAIRDSGDGYRLFQTDAAASPGSSGGGMFDDAGELIGIVSLKVDEAENINFALPSNYVRGLIDTEATMTLAELAERYPASGSREVWADDDADGLALEVLPELLAESAFEYDDLGDNVWGVAYPDARNVENLYVVVTPLGDLVLSQSFLVDLPPLSPEEMRQLLELNYDRNLIKVGIDPEGDLSVLNETEAAVLDAVALDRIVGNIALVTDEVAGLVVANRDGVRASQRLNETATLEPLDMKTGSDRERFELSKGTSLDLDMTEWRFDGIDEDGSKIWVHVDGDVYLKVIAERIEIPYDTLLETVVQNAMTVGEDVKVRRQGFRMVNGVRMMWLEMDAAISGIPFAFYSHVYSGERGSIQIHAWTGRNLLGQYRESIERAIAGFRVEPVR